MTKKADSFVLFCLEKYLSDEGAGFGSDKRGWTTEENATRFTEKERRVAWKPERPQCEWMLLPSSQNLKGYLLRATSHDGEIQGEMFFWATDADHAREQARDTEPEAKTWVWRVVSINGIPLASRAEKREHTSRTGRTIFLITKTGPEWQDPIEAWPDKKQAAMRAHELDEALDPNDVIDSLSRYSVVEITLWGN